MADSLTQLETLLRQMLQPNTEIVRQAGGALNSVLKQANSMPALLELVMKSPYPEIRQLAAVLMRKRIVGHWGKIAEDVQENIKKNLLHSLVNDPSYPVRRAVGALIGVIARILVPSGQWKELLDFLLQCTQSPNPEHREVAMGLFDLLTETIGDFLRPYFPVLQNIFIKGFQDPESRVKVATLKATGSLVHWLTEDTEAENFRNLLPSIVQGIQFAIANGFDDEALQAFEIFDDLVEMPLSPVTSCIPDLVNFVLSVGANKELDLNIRQRALTFIEWVVTFKPKALTKNKLVIPILQVLFPMSAESGEDVSDIEELTAHKFAAQLLDMLAGNVNPKHVFKPSLEFITNYVRSSSSNERKAGVIGLAVLSEGCASVMREEAYLQPLLSLIYGALKDPELDVREAGCIALGQFSKHLQPEITEHYQTVLPHIFQTLNDPTPQVRTSSCCAIEAFCENLGQEILPYLEPLMAKLLDLLRTGDREVQEVALSAISSLASAADKAFAPYYNSIMPLLLQMMAITDEQNIPLRCGATECAGLVAVAVGKDMIAPIAKDIMKLAIEGCVLDFDQLREYTYGFFANMAQVLKGDFFEFLPVVIPIVLASCDSTDGIIGTPESEDQLEGIEEDESGAPMNIHIRTAFLDEKAAACFALGMFAEHVGAPFLPFIDRIMKSFEELTSYFHEDVRQAVVISMKQMLYAVNAAYPAAKAWIKGVPEREQPLATPTRSFADNILPRVMNTMNTDDDKLTVGSACEVISELVDKLGPAVIEPHMPMLTTMLINLLEKKTTCQAHEEDLDEPEEEEEQDLELQLIEAACDALVDLSKGLGHLILPYFERLVTAVLKYQGKSLTSEYRSLAIGTVAEMCNALEHHVVPYVDALIPSVVKGMSDADPEVRSNSAYFAGVLMQHSGINGVKHYQTVLTALAPLFNDQALPNILDNACGAAARIILAAPSNALPLKEMLPVLLKSLPLRKDFQENPTVYRCLFTLLVASNEVLVSLLPQVLSIFGRVLGSSDLQPEVQAEMVTVTKQLHQKFTQFEQILQSLPEQENLRKFIN